MITGTVMPIADRIKKLKAGMKAHSYDETGSNPEKVTRTIVENEGRKTGEFLKVGDKVIESSATPDVKAAGIDLSGECMATNPLQMADGMDDDNLVQNKDDVQKEESIKKSAAPMAFSFGSTLQKVEKFRKPLQKCDTLSKAKSVLEKNKLAKCNSLNKTIEETEGTTVIRGNKAKPNDGYISEADWTKQVNVPNIHPKEFKETNLAHAKRVLHSGKNKSSLNKASNPYPKGEFNRVEGNAYDPQNEDHPIHISHHAAFDLATKHGIQPESYNQYIHEFENKAAQNPDEQVDFHKFMGWLGY